MDPLSQPEAEISIPFNVVDDPQLVISQMSADISVKVQAMGTFDVSKDQM